MKSFFLSALLAIPVSVTAAIICACVLVVGAVILFFIAKSGKSKETEKKREEPVVKNTSKPRPAPTPKPEPAPAPKPAPAPEKIIVAPKPFKEEGNTLKESLEKAARYSAPADRDAINKTVLADWLKETYKDGVIVNLRANLTSTGLPLADTHYLVNEKKNVCFAYVYEVKENCPFLLLKTDDHTAQEIREKYGNFLLSAFPKSSGLHWFTLFPQDYPTLQTTFEIIALVVARLGGESVIVSKPQPPEVVHMETVSREEAHEMISDEEATLLTEGKRRERTGKKEIVNLDVISRSFRSGETVTVQSLIEKKLVPSSAKCVKVLARGKLNKALTVIADDFSADAVKMIVITGGKAAYRE